jgi:hypothetical protein
LFDQNQQRRVYLLFVEIVGVQNLLILLNHYYCLDFSLNRLYLKAYCFSVEDGLDLRHLQMVCLVVLVNDVYF